ncbi:MAG: TPM domain-containing protein, partial [Gemmatimonadales bacterium]
MIGSRRKATALIAGLQLAFACLVWAQDAQIRALFPAQPAGHVTDAANVLDPTSAAEIESLAERLRGATGAEIAVVTLPTIGNYDAAQVALAIGRAWGVGARAEVGDQRRNAGLVVLLVPRRPDDPNSGHIRIEVG